MSDQPKVTGAPDTIWLVYGDLSDAPENEFKHTELTQYSETVTWCEDHQYPTDVRYIRADIADEAIALLRELVAIQDAERKHKLGAQDVGLVDRKTYREFVNRELELSSRRDAVDYAARQIVGKLK